MSQESNNNPSQFVGSGMQWPQNNDPYTQILPTLPIVNQPYYDLQPQFLPNNYPITTDTTPQLPQLPPMQFICNQANSGKCISFSAESPEMGPESDTDSSYNSSPDLLANINFTEMLQNELKPSNLTAKAPKSSQLLANAKPFFPRPQIPNSPDFQQTLDTVREGEESLSPSSSVSMLSTSAYSTDINPINLSPFMLNLDAFYADLAWLPLPESMHHFPAQTTPTNDTQQSMVTQVQIPQKKARKTFTAKFNNHAKGNFYISKEMISAMVAQCIEAFVTRDVNVNDEKLAFGYFKESVAMQINDKQIRVSHTAKGDIIVIHIDLHFADGAVMYLVAMENDFLHKSSVEWKIVQFMSADQIYQTYGITTKELPKSSRATRKFRDGVRTAPVNVPTEVIFNTNFRRLPGKKSKRNQGNGSGQVMSISEADLKYYCYESWNNGLMIPVVVVKGKNQWIEWKKFIQVCDRYNVWQWIGISLRYNSSNDEWKIECMDYDAGRIFYQYQLVGIQNIAAQYQIGYNELAQYITTSLNIY